MFLNRIEDKIDWTIQLCSCWNAHVGDSYLEEVQELCTAGSHVVHLEMERTNQKNLGVHSWKLLPESKRMVIRLSAMVLEWSWRKHSALLQQKE